MMRSFAYLAVLVGLAWIGSATAATPCQPEPVATAAITPADATGAWCVAGKAKPFEDDTLRFALPAAGLWNLSFEALPGQGGGLRLARYSPDGYHQPLWQGALA